MGESAFVHDFCLTAIDSRSGTRNIPLGLNGMILGPALATWVFAGSVFLPLIPDLAHQRSVGAQRDDSGPSVGDMGRHGFCFAAIDSRSGTRNIPLVLNGMILGPTLAAWALTGSVLRQLIPDLALQTSRWGTTG